MISQKVNSISGGQNSCACKKPANRSPLIVGAVCLSFFAFCGVAYAESGSGNTFSGNGAGGKNTSGKANTFLGSVSGSENTTGYNNTFVGIQSGYKNVSGKQNTYVGSQSGDYNVSGSFNSGFGDLTGAMNTSGSLNAMFGQAAGLSNQSGSENTFIGAQAGQKSLTGSGNVFLGRAAGYNEAGSNKLYIENSSSKTPLIYGEFDKNILTVNGRLGIGTTSPRSALAVNGRITAKSIEVTIAEWPDYVFDADYPLMPLSKVEQHIKLQGYLPGVPSQKTVVTEGLDLGEMNVLLMEKIEELTLHTIRQQKEIDALRQTVLARN
ncbi:hypothetical protein [Pseudovibrio sp. Tun.PSC04-5.I4]|uniref:hypothetical protein n=1 Tax=Pseudovibrio sp. Tun.PSC04-5.I4 TaxID=1798213 RepID=UPI00087F1006|nr:hypothetical protein [Pseudovibrio sp. Tun.PSC04-5.I4]SDR47919.1 hypothetical protein SAMN04515695_5885 [Pseudovibrio sp. Tun.PSC04-5.I4]